MGTQRWSHAIAQLSGSAAAHTRTRALESRESRSADLLQPTRMSVACVCWYKSTRPSRPRSMARKRNPNDVIDAFQTDLAASLALWSAIRASMGLTGDVAKRVSVDAFSRAAVSFEG